MTDFIEEQGPIAGWCQVIRLFATAAKAAGPDLNRRTFVTAMSKITDFPGTCTPVLSYGPDKRYGPTEYQVVRLHVNSPPEQPVPQSTSGSLLRPQDRCAGRPSRPWTPLPAPRDQRRPTPGAGRRSGRPTGGACWRASCPTTTVRRGAERARVRVPDRRNFADDRGSRAQRAVPHRLARRYAEVPLRERAPSTTWSCTTGSSTWRRTSLGLDRSGSTRAWLSAKYSGGADVDDEQLLHVDYGNHTLVVPRPTSGYQHLELFVYLSDVTPDTAATRMVSRRLTGDIPVERTYLEPDDYADLYDAEVPADGTGRARCSPTGPTSTTGARPLRHRTAARFLLHVAYKPAGTDWLGYQAWPGAAEGMAWHRFVASATLRQLLAAGFPRPGHPYWNDETLRGVAARYPGLDMTPWRAGRRPRRRTR